MNMQMSSSCTQGPIDRDAAIDPERFRSVMGAFATGVAVVATEWEGELFGATINSLDLGVARALHASVLHQRRQRDGDGDTKTRAVLRQHSRRASIRSVRSLHREAAKKPVCGSCRCAEPGGTTAVARRRRPDVLPGHHGPQGRRPRHHPRRGLVRRRRLPAARSSSTKASTEAFNALDLHSC